MNIFKKTFAIILLLSLFSGCIEDQDNDNNDYEKSVILVDYGKIFIDKNLINISELSVRTTVRNYIIPGDNKSGLSLTYLDGFQPYAKNDSGTLYWVHGKITNVAGNNIKNVTISVTFTNTTNNQFEIVRTKKFSLLTKHISHNFDIYLYDDVESFSDVNFIVVNVEVGKDTV